MSYVIKAVLSNPQRPECGQITAPFPIPVDQYDLWYQLRDEVLQTYRDDLPERLPLSQQTEFRRIKNLVVEEAVRLGEHTEVFTPADTQEPSQAGGNADPEPEEEALSGNALAMHNLGRMFMDGIGVDANADHTQIGSLGTNQKDPL